MKFARKKIILTSLFFLMSLFWVACQKDFSINADSQSFPIVYALFNFTEQDSNQQYIKIYKSYLSDNAYDGARQIQNYSYIDSIEVSVEEYNGSTLIRTIKFDTTTSIPKDSGIFAYPTQILYTAPLKCNPKYTYKLKVFNPYTNVMAEGTTVVPGEISLSQPHRAINPPILVAITENTFNVAFTTTDNAVAYQVVAKYYYSEVYNDNSIKHCQPITWDIGTATTNEARILYKMSTSTGSGFYKAIANGITDNDNVIRRYTDSIVFEVQAAAADWYKYLLATQPISSINQERIAYTNMKAYNTQTKEATSVLGFVSARSISRVRFDDLQIASGSRDSLFHGRFTGHLKFSDIH